MYSKKVSTNLVDPQKRSRAAPGSASRDADRTGVEVADPHHDAARHDKRGGGEAELLRPEERPDDDVAAGLHLTVDLHDDAVAQAVEQQRLLGLGQLALPGCPACLSDVSGLAPVPPSWPEMSTTSALAFDTPAATVPTPTSATSFTWIRALRVGVLEVVDELLEVLDGVDVVVRWRRDEAHSRGRVSGAATQG